MTLFMKTLRDLELDAGAFQKILSIFGFKNKQNNTFKQKPGIIIAHRFCLSEPNRTCQKINPNRIRLAHKILPFIFRKICFA